MASFPAARPIMAGLRAVALATLASATGRCRAVYVKPTVGGAVRYVTEQDIEVPSGAFPGATTAATNADWTAGKQPENLQYWPQSSFGTQHRIFLPCYKTYVLEDTAAGWAGKCKALMRNKMVATLEQCQAFCRLEPRCAVWQFVNQTTPGECWVGYGTHCSENWARSDGIVVQGSQRLQHGDVKVLAYLQGVKILNLYNLPVATIDPAQGEKVCKEWCYSDISCQYWQYNSRAGGCFVEARLFSTNQGSLPDKVVAYPLSMESGATSNAQWQIGEYIAHYCPPEQQSPVTAAPLPMPTMPPVYSTPAPQGGGFSWAWVAAAVALVLLIAGGGWYYQQQQQEQQKASSRRGRTGSSTSSRRGGTQNEDYEESYKSSYEEDRPLMQGGMQPEASNGYGYDQQRGSSQSGMSRSNSQQQTSAQQNPSSAPYPGQGAYGQGGYGDQGRGNPTSGAQYGGGGGQAGQQPGAGGYGQGGSMIPPPTQLVDFGNPGRMAPTQLFQNPGVGGMAPTQLMNQGMPYPSQTPGYPQRPPQGMM